MAGYCSCGSGRCCGDFGSCAGRAPSLVAIDVVYRIFHQAAANIAKRAAAARSGEMTLEEVDAANERLVNWIGSTFAGKNRHFETSEDWNPEGLANYLLQVLAPRFDGDVPVDEEEVIRSAGALFLQDAAFLLSRLLSSRFPVEAAAQSKAIEDLAERWAHLFTGAPFGSGMH